MDEKILSALASMIYVSRRMLGSAEIKTDDERIRASGLYDDWKPGMHDAYEICNAQGQTWECHQAHDNVRKV